MNRMVVIMVNVVHILVILFQEVESIIAVMTAVLLKKAFTSIHVNRLAA